MESYILKFNGFVIKHCKREAKRLSTSLGRTQLRFNVHEASEEGVDLRFATCKDYKFEVYCTIEEILNFPFGLDPMGFGNKIPPIIYMVLTNVANEIEKPVEDIYVFAAPDDNEQDVMAHIYHKANGYVKSLSMKDLILSVLSGAMEGGE